MTLYPARLLAAACLFVAAVFSGIAHAQSLVSSGQSFVSARILPGMRSDDGSRMTGLRLSMEQGWKTYWRSPGEAGIPPAFDWSESQNVKSVTVHWPRPMVFLSFGMQTIGYANDVVLPVHVVPQDPALPFSLGVRADLGVCKEICVIERFEISETVLPDQRAIGARQIERALARVPLPASCSSYLVSVTEVLT